MDKLNVLTEIKGFLDGYNTDLKYLVNVETNPENDIAECIIHEPGKEPERINVRYTPFMYMKDISLVTDGKLKLYAHDPDIIPNKMIQYGIEMTELKTGNHKRLKNGYCIKLTSTKSYNAIINFLRDGRINPYEKLKDDEGNFVRDDKGKFVYVYRDLYYSPRTTEQFFISTQSRLFKGLEEYKDVHRLTFDIETTGLRYQISRVFAIGVRDNRGFEIILEAEKLDDDVAEAKLIQSFFNLLILKEPAVVLGHNSEEFDFDFILGRARELKMDLSQVKTSLKDGVQLNRRGGVSVKYGNTSDKYTATEMWGISIIDTIHAAKRTAAVNSDIKATNLKYLAKFEKFARENRTYIKGEDNDIGRYYAENKVFVANNKNEHLEIPNEYQDVARKLYTLQANKKKTTDEQYKRLRKIYLDENKGFVNWFREHAMPQGMMNFIGGKKLVKQYLLDDLWETSEVDELYNQSSFLLAKIVPTTYQRICTMGTASVWNLLLTAWIYENDLAIPHPDEKEDFSGGLSRCYKVGYSTRIVKIDYASLYPMLQLTWDIFPMFDITGVIKKMLLYLTTTRNIYKKLATSAKLNEEEVALLQEIDHDVYRKLMMNEITDEDRAMFKIKQLPIKILNNSLFGALGSDISFNWSDNICAARITCNGRLELRHAISWFQDYNCIALLAVTDGINFQIPDTTTIRVSESGVLYDQPEGLIEDMWQYGGEKGIAALIEKFNADEMIPPYMSVDNDGESISCLNLARINYATLTLAKDKKTGEMKEKVKLTGNTLKSKVMPEYIEEFIDKGLEMILHGKGKEFVEYYYDYVDIIRYCQIPLKKIASKNRMKSTLKQYNRRGNDKNGRPKAKQAHMELIIEQRNATAAKLFEKHKLELGFDNPEKEPKKIEDKMKAVINWMPPEPELDSVLYQVNTGYMKSHGNSSRITDKETGEERFAATLISSEDLLENPDMKRPYNYVKYLDAFNKRVETLLVGFDEEVRNTLLCKIVKKKVKDEFGNKKVEEILKKKDYNPDMLELKAFDLDTYDESLHLEPKEVIFWNKTGYDPRLVWDGFKMFDDDKVYFEIYEGALKHLNGLMEKSGKPQIKSINDKYEVNDLVLIKDGSVYSLGKYNGVFMEIIRESIDVPKSDIELELDKKREEEHERLKALEVTLAKESEMDKYLKAVKEKQEKYFPEFLKNFGLPETTMEKLFAEVEEARGAFDAFIIDIETAKEEEASEYLDLDDGGDGAY